MSEVKVEGKNELKPSGDRLLSGDEFFVLLTL